MEEDVASCIIHFGDVSSEILRQFTAVSLSKFTYCQKIWMGLTGAQNEIAVKSPEKGFLAMEQFRNVACNTMSSVIENLWTKPKLREHNQN